FHSVYYSKMDNRTLSVSAYNKLGTTASHGCVRLTCGDAKWIYDNCALKTQVIIISSGPDPLSKPSAAKLPSWHTWDPTDPTI
ncbi:MAG: L,D-transpeptidase, partial [Faecalibacillus sp.]